MLRALRFNNKLIRQKNDKLDPIREVFENLMANCTETSKFVTVNETLVGFQGRCSFRMDIPSKAEKFGIKIWSCVDSHSKYLYNARVYLGKQGNHEKKLGMEVVLLLTRDLTAAGRTIVTDNSFTSPQPGQKKTHSLGTVRSNRQGIPKDFLNEKFELH